MQTLQTFLSQPMTATKICDLEKEIALIDEWKNTCSLAIKDLMAKEQNEKIFFPKEIFEYTQQRNVLETHREMRRVRIARLKLEEQY